MSVAVTAVPAALMAVISVLLVQALPQVATMAVAVPLMTAADPPPETMRWKVMEFPAVPSSFAVSMTPSPPVVLGTVRVA